MIESEDIKIVETNDSDLEDILSVERQAFGSEKEAELVRLLLNDDSASPVVSLLAYYEEEAVGHILFTKAGIQEIPDSPLIYILAPLAVVPKHQKKGIGGLLIREGIQKLKEMDTKIIFVLGYPDYYPRHGFITDAANLGFPAPFPIPHEVKDAWMILPLTDKDISQYSGKVSCADVMNKPEYWRE